MFGNKAPFGNSSTFQSNTFGTPSPFGQNASAFGGNKSLGTGFGTSAFGGAPPNTSIFSGSGTSGGSIFGANTSNFGQTAAPSTAFGSFSSTPASGSNLFSAQPTAGTSLFQSPSTSAFGAPKSSFGSFGNTTSTSLFNQNQPSTSLFNQSGNTGTSLFGSSGSTFPTVFSAGTSGQNGTTLKFNPVTGTDTMIKNGVTTTISIRHQCITVMKEYEGKSLEELRMEDYAASRKGPQQGTIGSFGGNQTSVFGASATPAASTGLFQSQNKSIFGATNSFGGGTTSTNAFGQPMQQQNTGLFGPPKPVGFGSAVPTTSAFTFSSNTGSNMFGSTTTQQNKSLFGTNATQGTTTGLFGSNNTLAQPSAGFGNTGFNAAGFGVQNQANVGLFGNKNVFGTTTTSAPSFSFGNPANTSVSATPFAPKTTNAFGTGTGFGTSTNTFGGFGSGTSLFNQNKPTSSFGNTGTTGFGTGLSGLGTSGGSLFTANKPGGLTLGTGFGTNTNTGFGTSSNLNLMGTPLNMSSNNLMLGSDQNAAQLAQQQTQAQQQLLALAQSPFGDSPLFRNVLQDSGKREEILKPTNPAAQRALTNNNQYKISPRPAAKVKPKPLHVVVNGKASLFDGFDEDDADESLESFVPRKSFKKLVLKPKSSPQLNKVPTVTATGSMFESNSVVTSAVSELNKSSNLSPENRNSSLEFAAGDKGSESAKNSTNSSPESIIGKFYANSVTRPVAEHSSRNNSNVNDTINDLNINHKNQRLEDINEFAKEIIVSDQSLDGSSDNDTEPELVEPESQVPHPAGLVLRRVGYYTLPTLEVLAGMTDENGDCFVENFVVGREGFGNVFFFGVTNVADLNLDEIVHFRKKEVTVYPDDDNKPPLGEGLNKKAQITLDGVWPMDKTTCTPITSPERLKAMRYQEKLESVSAKLNAKFIDYRPETGSWVFQVSHFSKYGLEDSDEETTTVPNQEAKKLKTLPTQVKQVPGSLATEQQKTPQTKSVSELSERITTEDVISNGFDHNLSPRKPIRDEDDEMEDVTQQSYSRDFYTDDEDDNSNEVYEPPSHRLAKALGVSSQRVQIMKASLFPNQAIDAVDELIEDKENLISNGNFKGKKSSLSQNSMSKQELSTVLGDTTLPRKSFYVAERLDDSPRMSPLLFTETISRQPVQAPEYELDFSKCIRLPSGFVAALHARRTVSGARLRKFIPFSRSRLSERQHLLADAACFMGRRFRVGWGPNWTITHCGSRPEIEENIADSESDQHLFLPYVNVPTNKSQLESTGYTVTVEKVNVQSLSSVYRNSQVDKLEQCLEVQLANSKCAMENGSPIVVPTPGVTSFHQQAALAANIVKNTASDHPDMPCLEHFKHVWNLCVALWGHIPGYNEETESGNTHAHRMARRRVFSEWAQAVTQRTIREEIQRRSVETEGHLASIFNLLSGCQINEACQVAQDSSEHRLALLLAQAGSSTEFRQMVQKQLENWEQLKADKYISPERLKINALLAGNLVWPSSRGLINTCDNLDWKRALAVHLWYSCSPMASVTDALLEYTKAFKGTSSFGKYCSPPLPPYLENDAPTLQENEKLPIYDVCYHLLRLYMKRSHRLDRLLCPSTFTANPLDHRLSWLLYQGLIAAGFDHLSEYRANSLHLNFASQLESCGLWHWAIFVILHIADPERRYTLVNELLSRYISLKEDPKIEEFLHNQLLIPKEWIALAKAYRARNAGYTKDEAWYLLKAGQWNQSHEIILRHIAPDAIINENYDYLKSFLVELAPLERKATIQNWNSGGLVYLDYIQVSQTLDKIVKRELGTYELERLQPEVTSLCDRVANIECHNAKERLCQSEMAKKTATLLRAVLSLQNGEDSIACRLLVPHLTRLPMPGDYALQELRNLTHNYLVEMTS